MSDMKLPGIDSNSIFLTQPASAHIDKILWAMDPPYLRKILSEDMFKKLLRINMDMKIKTTEIELNTLREAQKIIAG